MATKKGYELAAKLAPAIGYTDAVVDLCSAIARNAATLHRLNEEGCNGHPANADGRLPIATVQRLQARWEERVDRQTEATLKRLDSLVRDLPETDAGPWRLKAEEDPRGCSVILAPADGIIHGDSWGGNGVCIP